MSRLTLNNINDGVSINRKVGNMIPIMKDVRLLGIDRGEKSAYYCLRDNSGKLLKKNY